MRHTPRHTLAAFAPVALAPVALAVALCALAGPAAAIISFGALPEDAWAALPNTASSGAFTVTQVATADMAQFSANWNKPGQGANLKVTTQIARRRPLNTFITFRGCRPDPHGKCNVTATFELRSPSGKVQPIQEIDVWANHTQPAAGVVQLSRGSVGLTFDETDAAGVHTLRAHITDHVAGVTLHTAQKITVTP